MKLYTPKRSVGKTTIKSPRFSGKSVKMPKLKTVSMKAIKSPKAAKGRAGKIKI